MEPNETLAQDDSRHPESGLETRAARPGVRSVRVAAPAVHTRTPSIEELTRAVRAGNRHLSRIVRTVSAAEGRRRLDEQRARATHVLRQTVERREREARRPGGADPLLTQQIHRINRRLDDIDRQERQQLLRQNAALMRRNQQLETRLRRPVIQPGTIRAAGRRGYSARNQAFAIYRRAALQYLRTGQETFNGMALRDLERRAGMHTENNPDGGYFIHPEYDTGPLEGLLLDAVVMRQVATVRSISGPSLKKPVNLHGATVEWVGERQTRDDTNTPDIAEIDVPAKEMAANVLASQQLLEDSSIDIEAFLAEEVIDAFSQEEEFVFTSGDGVNKPKGLLAYDTVENANWVWGKFGYIVTGKTGAFIDAAAAANQGDVLWQLIYSLKAGHRANAKFMMNSGTVGVCRTLKDGEGRWIWADAREGNPAKLCGFDTVVNEQMPEISSDSLSIAFGDFARTYLIVDRVGVNVLRDPYTRTPYVRFYTRKRVGGGVQNFEATKFLKFATS